MSYAIIKVGGKQYKVQAGQSLLVDRLKADEGATFTPDLLFVPDADGGSVTVTARVVGHEKGEKIRIGKYRRRTGYKRHTGFRASLTRIAIESIGSGESTTPAGEKPKRAPRRKATPSTEAATPVAEETTETTAAADEAATDADPTTTDDPTPLAQAEIIEAAETARKQAPDEQAPVEDALAEDAAPDAAAPADDAAPAPDDEAVAPAEEED